MNIRKQKYFKIKNVYTFFNENKANIFLYLHINDLNSIENILMYSYLKKYNIQILNNKLNLMKKITTNVFFFNLWAGPTKIFAFSNFSNLLSFLDYISLKKKLIPLTIYWNNNFYLYSFFIATIRNYLNKNKNFLLELPLESSKIIVQLIKPLNQLLLDLNFTKLFLVLNIYIEKK